MKSFFMYMLIVLFLWTSSNAQEEVEPIIPDRLEAIQEFLDYLQSVLVAVEMFLDPAKVCSASDLIVFFEGNYCSQTLVGSYNLSSPNNDKTCPEENIKDKDCWDNDEARSLLLLEGVPAKAVIKVCDDPNDCNSDDFAVIETKKAITHPICVGSFERTYSDENVTVSYVKITNSGSLDGKVSRVSACNYG